MIKILRLILSLLGAIGALFCVHSFNLFDYIRFVPADKSYDVCITVYFTLVEGIINYAWDFFGLKVKSLTTEIQTIFYTESSNVLLGNTPLVQFNDLDIAHISIRVSINGNVKSIGERKIIIPAMSQIDFQIERMGTALTIDNDGNVTIDLQRLCGNQNEVNLSEDFKIILQRGSFGEHAICELSSSMDKKSAFVSYEHNRANIVIGD